MTEDEARDWVQTRYGSGGTSAMEHLVALVEAEARHQNLISPSTFATIWNRHIVDSAQLIDFAGPTAEGWWIDIGSGAGFPGLVVATLGEYRVCLIEPRKRRAEFLCSAVDSLGLHDKVDIRCERVQTVAISGAVISARAVAPLSDILDWGAGSAQESTRWIMPKGRSATEEVATAKLAWHGMFHVEQSITDPDSLIVVASGVKRR